MDILNQLLDAHLEIAGYPILWREIIGNAFGLLSAYWGMKRVVWAWPVGMIGNALLFTVFMGSLFSNPQNLDLYGQSGRQIMFLCVSAYGWYQWAKAKKREPKTTDPSRSIFTEPHEECVAVQPHWATSKERIGMSVAAVVLTVVFWQIFAALGSWGPLADAWIFTGSLLATYGMAKGWTEFWLIWIGVDLVGVPLLIKGGFYPSAVLYIVYGAFVLWGFVTWRNTHIKKLETTS